MTRWNVFGRHKICPERSRPDLVYLIIFLTNSAIFALCFFLFGFFPMKTINGNFSTRADIPSKIYNLSFNNKDLYQRHIGRLVFVLIDAFRWDFVEVPEHMPYISELRKSNQATLLTARCHPPTATMPRIKALMTGTVPNYIDVMINLGSDEVTEDNLIYQGVENNLKPVFYGDETWLNLFPHKFIRHEGTSSFFVFDYTEVDLNVTRNIPNEMKQKDWDILILHYLGLDHIGHFAGPSSNLIPGKLKEMDAVIKLLHESLQNWDLQHPEEPPSFLVVVGDHGMHDSGSHGGATLGEVLVSLVLIESTPLNSSVLEWRPEVSEIDVAATLSVLLGLPIPNLSLGVLIPYALQRLTHQQYLFALFYNAQVVAKQFILFKADGPSRECFIEYLEAQRAHISWLESGSDDLRQIAEKHYLKATREMSNYLVKKLVSFDVRALVISCLILIQVVLCLFLVWALGSGNLMETGRKIFAAFLTGLTVIAICDQLYSSNARYVIILIVSAFIIGTQWWILFMVPYCLQYRGIALKKIPFLSVFLSVGCVLHSVSLSSSSLIEEEHQTWYFLWITLMLLTFFKIRSSTNGWNLQLSMTVVLLGHRLLRKLNQTGDKWASLPDISDWLEMSEHHIYLTFIFIFGLFGVWRSLISLHCISNTIDKVLLSLALTCVILYRAAVGDISYIVTKTSRGIRELQLFWFWLGLIFLRSLIRFKHHFSLREGIKAFILIWVLIVTLLLKPCNVILVPYVVLSSFLIQSCFKRTVDCTICHVWLGTVVFFYQGNSNSLSTIDVAVGNISTDRADHYNMVTVGLFVFIHTFSFPILTTLLLWQNLTSQPAILQRKEDFLTSLQVSFLQRLLPLSTYCVLVTFQREHLFLWSVFAPKLLYEACHAIITFVFVALGCVLLNCCDT